MEKIMWYIYTMEYYSAMRKKEILPFATTLMNPDSIIPSEISQTEKAEYCIVSLTCGIRKKKSKSESRKVVAKGLGLGEIGTGW